MSVAVNTPTQAKHRVLVVDDEPDFVANLVDILEDAGFDIDSTTKPREAVELASEHRYDAAILDWRMPGLDGVRLHGLLRERQQDLATILLTAYADAETHYHQAMTLARDAANQEQIADLLRNLGTLVPRQPKNEG